MSWDVHLWCNVCLSMIGVVHEVQTQRPGTPEQPSVHSVHNIMRDHEVEKHGGTS